MIYGASIIRLPPEITKTGLITNYKNFVDIFKSSTGMDPADSGIEFISTEGAPLDSYYCAYFTFLDKHLGFSEIIDLRTIFLSFMHTLLHEVFGKKYDRPGFIILNDLKKHEHLLHMNKIPDGRLKGLFHPAKRSGYTAIKFEE